MFGRRRRRWGVFTGRVYVHSGAEAFLLSTLQGVHQPERDEGGEQTQVSVGKQASQSRSIINFLSGSTHHSIASSRPVPLVADVLKICHFLSLRAGRPRALATSVGVMAWSMSCLLAKTTRMAFFSSSSWRTHRAAELGHDKFRF